MLFDFDEEMEEFDADATQSEDEEFENAKDEEIDLDIDMRDDQDEIECLAFIEFEPIDEDEDYTPSRREFSCSHMTQTLYNHFSNQQNILSTLEKKSQLEGR